MFECLEKNKDAVPIDTIVASTAKISTKYISEIWDKAIARKSDDPEGAITIARTLLEATCKYILDKKM